MQKRLEQIASLVKGPVAVDVGTDHGRLPAMLLNDPAIKKVIATDISRASLNKCRDLLRSHPHRSRAELVVTDGLDGIDTKTVDTIVISGMGGHRIIGILARALHAGKSLRRLILSPQKGEEDVRRFLHESGFQILSDFMLREAGKYYTILVAAPGAERYGSDLDYRYGKHQLKDRDPVLLERVRQEIRLNRSLLKKEISDASRQEIVATLKELKEVCDALGHPDIDEDA